VPERRDHAAGGAAFAGRRQAEPRRVYRSKESLERPLSTSSFRDPLRLAPPSCATTLHGGLLPPSTPLLLTRTTERIAALLLLESGLCTVASSEPPCAIAGSTCTLVLRRIEPSTTRTTLVPGTWWITEWTKRCERWAGLGAMGSNWEWWVRPATFGVTGPSARPVHMGMLPNIDTSALLLIPRARSHRACLPRRASGAHTSAAGKASKPVTKPRNTEGRGVEPMTGCCRPYAAQLVARTGAHREGTTEAARHEPPGVGPPRPMTTVRDRHTGQA